MTTTSDQRTRRALTVTLALAAATTTALVIAYGWATALAGAAAMLAFTGLVYFGRRRSETLDIIERRRRQANSSLYNRASAIAGHVMVYVLVAWWFVSLATGDVNETVNVLCAIAGVTFSSRSPGSGGAASAGTRLVVADGREIEPVRRSGRPRLAPVRTAQQLLERRELAAPARDLEHRADEDAVHVAHERVGLDLEGQDVAGLLPGGREDLALETPVDGLRRRERGEVVHAGQRRRAGAEQIAIQAMRPPQRASVLERRALTAVQHAVAIGTRERVTARVEALVRGRARAHGDVRRQQPVQALQRRRVALVRGDLPGRVHAAVSASGDRQPDRLGQQRRQHAFQLGLDGALPRLPRPAREIHPVVLDVEARDGHAASV